MHRFSREISNFCAPKSRWNNSLLNYKPVDCNDGGYVYRVDDPNTFKLEEAIKSVYALGKDCKTNNDIGVTCIEQTQYILNLAERHI